MAALGALFAEGGVGVPRDMKRALSLLRRAADGGDNEAKVNLASLLEQDPSQLSESCRLLHSAIAKGFPKGQVQGSVVACHTLGHSFERDLRAAARILLDAYPGERGKPTSFAAAVPRLHVIYRLSDHGHGASKARPSFVGLRECWRNFAATMRLEPGDWLTVIADNVGDATWGWAQAEVAQMRRGRLAGGGSRIWLHRTNVGNPGSFRLSLGLALECGAPHDAVTYFVEDDYIHRAGARRALLEGAGAVGDYLTLYDHPDKYSPQAYTQGAPRILVTSSSYWRTALSTTMTFAATVSTLRVDEEVLDKFTSLEAVQSCRERSPVPGFTIPWDHELFVELGRRGRLLAMPMPGYATHGEAGMLSPAVDWASVMAGPGLQQGPVREYEPRS